MEVEDGLVQVYIFFFEDEAADGFAFVVNDIEIDPFDDASVELLLFGPERVDVVGVLGGGDDCFPCAFEVVSEAFHQ